MGTSSIYRGPKDKKDTPTNSTPETQISKQDWKNVKNLFSRYIKGRSTGGGVSLSNVTRAYVKSQRGTEKLLEKSQNAIVATRRLLGIISSFQQNGFVETLHQNGINIDGLPIQQALAILSAVIAPDTDTKDDSVLRYAAIETMSKLFTYVESNEMDINIIDRMDDALQKNLVKTFISEYIFGLVMKDLFSKFEQYQKSNTEIAQIENEYKEFINSKVDVEIDAFLRDNNLSDIDIEQKVAGMYGDIFDVLGGEL
jgi:hypothetical protein